MKIKFQREKMKNNDWIVNRMFYQDKEGIDKTIYSSLFGNLINEMESFGFSVRSFEFIEGVKNLRIDFDKSINSRNAWLGLTEKLRETEFFIQSFKINPELLKINNGCFLDLSTKFADSLEKEKEKPLLSSVQFSKGDTIFLDYWFDYTR